MPRKMTGDLLEKQARKLILANFYNHFGVDKVEFINMHGSAFMKKGLPDLLIMITNYKPYWIEIKRNVNDTPTKLQQHRVKTYSRMGFITGFSSGRWIKFNWDDLTSYTIDRFITLTKQSDCG